MSGLDSQRTAARAKYAAGVWEQNWRRKYADPVYRFLRRRRLDIALGILTDRKVLDPPRQSALVVCGGAGEEGVFLREHGFATITVSDLSEDALATCRSIDPGFATAIANAENMRDLRDESYDIVVVQDGLHHLQRPVQGFTEMLRVARVAAIVIEPHYGLAGTLLGTKWERDRGAVNYVFRWNHTLLEQATYSYLLRDDVDVICHRLWDHPFAVARLSDRLPRRLRLTAVRALYGALKPLGFTGNMMVGVVVKSSAATR